jgi:hypothetical protein
MRNTNLKFLAAVMASLALLTALSAHGQQAKSKLEANPMLQRDEIRAVAPALEQ